MSKRPFGCLTPLGLIAAVLTALILTGIVFAQGGVLFSPGPLNATATKQPLGGVSSHAQIPSCDACHVPPWFMESMTDRCLRCHTDVAKQISQSDTLHGALAVSTADLFCARCHPEHRGADAPLTIADLSLFPHEQFGFSLVGHRQTVEGREFTCRDCHLKSLSTFDPHTCLSCHRQQDPVFMEQHLFHYPGDCLACHDGRDRFGRGFVHPDSPFALTGQHQRVECHQCHGGAKSAADFALAATDCFSCHANDDPHEGRFGTQCENCHTTNAWKPAQFDHNLAAFKLEGAHASVACTACHINNVFKGTPTDCFSCHANDDPHRGQFGTQCQLCHRPTQWRAVTFDHNRTAFPLTGAHLTVPCQSCHINGVYKGTPTECAACHREPAFHAGLFRGQSCAHCHQTTAWRPASFFGPHTFPMMHGGASSCQTCHPNSLQTYTCYSCHEHNPAKIQKKHLKEGITNFQNCVACHPTGQEHEGKHDDDDHEHDDDDDD